MRLCFPYSHPGRSPRGRLVNFGAQFTFKMAAENQRENFVASYLLAVAVLRRRRERREGPKHRFWVRKIFQKREEAGNLSHSCTSAGVLVFLFCFCSVNTKLVTNFF